LPFLRCGIYVSCDFLALRNSDDLFSSLLESPSKSEDAVLEELFGVVPQIRKESDVANAIFSIGQRFLCSLKCSGERLADRRFADLGGDLSLNVVKEEDQTTLETLLCSMKNEDAKFLQVTQ
jgi:hypothetical protein